MRTLLSVTFLLVLSTCICSAAETRMRTGSSDTRAVPTLSETDVMHLVEQKAKLAGWKLSGLNAPTITFQPKGQPGKWLVFYTTKVVMPDGCFSILVDDKSKAALFEPCG